jgi:hypothetical protein
MREHGSDDRSERRDRRLADPPVVERYWTRDHDAQLAALRVVLGLPRRPVTLDREAL